MRSGTDGGAGLKPSDRFVVPLCTPCHDRQHRVGELTFWAELGADPVDLSNRLWAVTGDDDQGLRAIARFHQSIEMHKAHNG